MRYLLTACMIGLTGLTLATAPAQDPSQPTDAAPEEAGQSTGEASAEDVLNELLRRRTENPLIEPAKPDRDPQAITRPGAGQPIGTAPGVGQTKLKREGQFIIMRRARMVRATAGASPWMLTFAADADGLADPPMFVMPCQMLEDMEDIIEDRGNDVEFIISGQVFVYHGANYLLPTLMKLAPNMGNLNP